MRPATVPRSRALSPVLLACDSHDIPQLERCSQTNEWTLTEWYPPFGKLSQRQTKMQIILTSNLFPSKSEADVLLTGFLRELFVI